MFPYINWCTPLTSPNKFIKRGPKGPITCTWVQCATFFHGLARVAIFIHFSAQKNTNLVEDIKILLPVKFRWIPFSGFRGKVKICLSQSEARAAILFFGSAQKHKLGRGHWELAFCQVLLNSVQWFHRSQKCLSQSEDRAAILFLISLKNASLVEDVEILLPVKFCWILFSGFRGKVKNVSANHRPERPFCFSDPPEKHKLGRGRWDLATYQVSSNSFHSFRGEVENVSTNQRPGRPFCFFPICLKNINVVEGIESLLPVKFRWIPFSGFRGEVEKCLSQSEARAAILFFRSAQKRQTW